MFCLRTECFIIYFQYSPLITNTLKINTVIHKFITSVKMLTLPSGLDKQILPNIFSYIFKHGGSLILFSDNFVKAFCNLCPSFCLLTVR